MRFREVHFRQPSNEEYAKGVIRSYGAAINALNECLHLSFEEAKLDATKMDELQSISYETMFIDHRMNTLFLSGQSKRVIRQIAQIIIHRMLACDLPQITGVPPEQFAHPMQKSRQQWFTDTLHIFVLILILANVVCLTLSLDVAIDCQGWQSMEMMFTISCLLKFLSQMGIIGIAKHFCGFDMQWIIFDAVVVIVERGDPSAVGCLPHPRVR